MNEEDIENIKIQKQKKGTSMAFMKTRSIEVEESSPGTTGNIRML